MSGDEKLLKSVPQVFLFSKDQSWLRRLWSGGQEASGTVVLTDRRLAFIKSKRGLQSLAGGPQVEAATQIDALVASQGGFAIALAEIESAIIAASGRAGYAYGQGAFSDLTIKSARGEKTFRFFGDQTAAQVLNLLMPASAPPRSPVEAELAELGFPRDYGLPAPPEERMRVTWYRATLGFAYRTLKEGKLDFAINDANKLIEDADLQTSPRYALVLAAAYYVRGSAFEQKGDKVQAALNYQAALERAPEYALAARAWERVR